VLVVLQSPDARRGLEEARAELEAEAPKGAAPDPVEAKLGKHKKPGKHKKMPPHQAS
jgi:hypothetical protein